MEETLSVREAREQLSTLLRRFRSGERTSIGAAPHRKTEAVPVPLEVVEKVSAVLEEVATERTQALQEAVASARAEGLTIGTEAQAITESWAQGEISTERMRELIRRRHGVQ